MSQQQELLPKETLLPLLLLPLLLLLVLPLLPMRGIRRRSPHPLVNHYSSSWVVHQMRYGPRLKETLLPPLSMVLLPLLWVAKMPKIPKMPFLLLNAHIRFSGDCVVYASLRAATETGT
jgi:hypothetical protein